MLIEILSQAETIKRGYHKEAVILRPLNTTGDDLYNMLEQAFPYNEESHYSRGIFWAFFPALIAKAGVIMSVHADYWIKEMREEIKQANKQEGAR